MNKKRIRKIFDEKYWDDMLNRWELKNFVFETIIPEVLKSIIDRPFLNEADELYREWYDDCIKEIKQKAKDLYSVTL